MFTVYLHGQFASVHTAAQQILLIGQRKATIHQLTTILATSKMSYFQVITTC